MRIQVVRGVGPAGRPKGLRYVLSLIALGISSAVFAQSPPARATATIGGKTSLDDLRDIWRTSGRPVIWAAFFQRDDRPEYVPERLAATERFAREGVEVLPQVSCRPLTMDFTMKNPYPSTLAGQ